MDEREKAIRKKLKSDYPHYSSRCLKVRTKAGLIKPFILNKAQIYLHEAVEQQKRATGKVRIIVLKGRQQGMSTYIEGRFYWLVTHHFGIRAFILTHEIDATNNLFEMAERFHDFCPELVKPSTLASNAKELIFAGLDSGYKLGTAGNKSVGRSSTIQLLHGSEVAYWQHAAEHAKGIMQAVPNEAGTEVFFESTANGIGNYFHEQWQLAEAKQSEFLPIFIPWFWQPEYAIRADDDFTPSDEEIELIRLYDLNHDQLSWRRMKIVELSAGGGDGIKAFHGEYPCTPVEAFDTSGEDNFIPNMLAANARKAEVEAYGPKIVGVDPARFGDDRTSIIRRQGRVAYNLQSYLKKDTMEIVGFVHKIILDESPDKVCIDIGGLGAGIYDRLKELGHEEVIVAVNGGATPLNGNLYYNKRAEMWGEMKAWLEDYPCKIPDSDSLHADLCGLKYKFDSKTRLLMEKKEEMKKRGVRSPDEADALALTFSCPPNSLRKAKQWKEKNAAQIVMSKFNEVNRLRKTNYRK